MHEQCSSCVTLTAAHFFKIAGGAIGKVRVCSSVLRDDLKYAAILLPVSGNMYRGMNPSNPRIIQLIEMQDIPLLTGWRNVTLFSVRWKLEDEPHDIWSLHVEATFRTRRKIKVKRHKVA